MATPSLTKHTIPGSLGEIFIDVRTGHRYPPRPAVIVMHGFKGFKDWGMFPTLADRLARAGMTAVSFNVSGSGVDDAGEFSLPDRFGKNTFSAELKDLDCVINALSGGKALGLVTPSSIGLVGHSRGGGIVILETSRNPRIDALVSWSAIGSVNRWSEEAKAAWRRRGFLNIQNTRTGQVMPLSTDVLDDIERHALDTLDIPSAASRIEDPWLIFHGEADETVDKSEGETLAALARKGKLLLLPEAGHTFGAVHPLKEIPAPLDRVLGETVSWFSRHLG